MTSSNDIQRLFLQAVFSRGILSYKHALVLWAKCIDAVKAANPTLDVRASDKRREWDAFVGGINESLNCLDLEFRHVMDETLGVEMYAVVNTRGDEIAQMATDYTPAEIAYFRTIVEQIMLAPNECYSLSSLAALREVNSLKANMTKSQGEAVLNSLVAKGWLLKSKRGRYSLSTRTLLELLPYLKSNYPDECLECTICMEMVTRGVACTTAKCQSRMHQQCFMKFRAQKSQCPTCQCAWPQDVNALRPIGERAIKDGQNEGRRRRKSTSEEASDSEREDENNEDEPEPPQPRRTQKKKDVEMEVDDVDEEDDDDDEEQPMRRSGRRSSTQQTKAVDLDVIPARRRARRK
ncbi:Nse1 non-SMC component of SMC5-6 complex-domain-containing protein [Scleroderma yunnanense]